MFQEKSIQSNTVRIDWSEVWNRQVLRRREFGKVVNSAGQWDSRESAFGYWETTMKTQYGRIKDTINEIEITSRSRVLDIGSGPGVIALPLSNRVAHITAIEPLKGMVEVMREKIVQRKIQNIKWIQKYWEEIDVDLDLEPLYDVVIASLSLNMIGIRDAIKKMNKVCSKFVYLYWFAGEPSWETHSKKLIPLLHGTPFVPMPKCDMLFNVLYEMGIYPHIKVLRYQHPECFDSFRDLLFEFCEYYQVTTSSQEKLIKNYLLDLLKDTTATNSHGISIPSSFTCVKMWWQKT